MQTFSDDWGDYETRLHHKGRSYQIHYIESGIDEEGEEIEAGLLDAVGRFLVTVPQRKTFLGVPYGKQFQAPVFQPEDFAGFRNLCRFPTADAAAMFDAVPHTV